MVEYSKDTNHTVKTGVENLQKAKKSRNTVVDGMPTSSKSYSDGVFFRLHVFGQGETDAAKEDHAHTYYGRFEALVTDVRDLGYPELKIFTVAVTGTTDRLPYLPQVRICPLTLRNQFAALFGMAIVF